jgi:flagellar motor protein MotB
VRRRRAPAELFPVNVWPPFVDAVVLALAAFVLLTMLALLVQRRLLERVHESDRALAALRADKERIERRLRALAPSGTIEVEEGKVILQGEVLFDSGSDELRASGRAFLERMGPNLATLLEAEPTQMVLIGGHTDDRTLRGDGAFASNWALSTARAVAVTRVLMSASVPGARLVAAGFGAEHPRVANIDEAARRKNRRIEVLLVPIASVASR